MPDIVLFVDTETTGLDETKDHILELAIVAVRLPRFEIIDKFSSVVVPPLWPTVRRNMHEKVEAMHEASGLLLAVDEACTFGPPEVPVEEAARAFVRHYRPEKLHTPKPELCGANPDFDRRFLARRMPKLHAAFHYRNFDVRSITLLQDWIFGVEHRESPHRALSDCLKAIQDVREFLGIEAVVANKPRSAWGVA